MANYNTGKIFNKTINNGSTSYNSTPFTIVIFDAGSGNGATWSDTQGLTNETFSSGLQQWHSSLCIDKNDNVYILYDSEIYLFLNQCRMCLLLKKDLQQQKLH